MPSVPFARFLQPSWQALSNLARIRPKTAKRTVGLDVGSASIKVVIMGPPKALRARSLLAHHVVPFGDSPEASASGAIKALIGGLHLPIKSVHLSVSGQWVIMRVVEMPVLKPQELAQALPFEAQRYLPFNIQDVVLDGAILGPADANKLWVLIVACKRELLERRIEWVRQAGLEPAAIDIDALAVANAFADQLNGTKASGVHALINVGAQWTNLAVLKGGIPYLVRDIPWGAAKWIRHMAEGLGAEEATLATQVQQASVPPELQPAMKASCEALTTELQLSFDFFENRFGPSPEQVFVTGGLSQCAGFLDAFKSHLAQPLAVWTPGQGLPGQFSVAYGLALRPPVG